MSLVKNKVEVFFDGSCPICRREIAFYMRCKGSNSIEWIDISLNKELNVTDGLSKEDASARFHIRSKDGSIVSGAKAFAVLWSELDAFKILGNIALLWPFNLLLEISYRVFLKFRPILQRLIH